MERDELAWCAFGREVAEALAVLALFVGLGLGGAWLGAAAYPRPAMAEQAPEAPRIWLVDGFNVLHAAVLQGRDRREWWRGPARSRVLALAAELPDPDAEIWVVFDGTDPDDLEDGAPPRVRQVFAPSADDWMVRRVKATPRGAPITVVTADRQLADRARHHGAEIVSPRAFAERCKAS